MADFAVVRDGLRDRLATITGLRAYDTAPGTIEPPAAVVAPAHGTFLLPSSFGRGSFDLRFTVYLMVSKSWERTAQDKLDGYLSSTGTDNVWAAIEDAPVTGTQFAVVTGIGNYGQIVYAGMQFYGVQITVSVGAV